MTAVAKTSLTADVSLLVQGDAADATDVIPAVTDLLNHAKSGRVAVSSADTHVKHLEDALTAAGGGGITLTKTNPSANESLAIAVDATVAKLASAQAITNKTLDGTNDIDPAALTAGGAANGEVLIWNGSAWMPGANGGGGALPVDITVTAGETLAQRDFVYLDMTTGTWFKVDIDATPVKVGRWRGLVTQSGGIASAATGTVRLMGEVSGFSGLTPWAYVYAVDTPGAYYQAMPSPVLNGSQIAVVPIGLATSASKILLMGPSKMQYRKRGYLANLATLLIEHHADPFGYGRRVTAFVNTADVASIQSYATANFDTTLSLKGPSGAGAAVSVDTTGTTLTAVGAGASDQFKAAQSVVLTAGVLTQITFFLDANTGTPNTANITVEIRANNAGIPAVGVLWTTSHAATASANNTITNTDGTFFDAGTYWIVWSVPTQTLNNRYNLRYNTANPYGAGTAKSDSSASAGTWVGTLTGTPDIRCTITTSPVTVYDRILQGFSHAATLPLSSAKFYMRKVGTPADTITASVYTADGSGNPDTLAGSGTIVASSLTTSWVQYDIPFSPPFNITSSIAYVIVLSSSGAASNTNFVQIQADTSSASYANGVAKTETSSVWSAIGGDLIFDLIAAVTSYNEPCVIGRSSGGTRDVSVRYDNGTSGVNTSTNTLGKNVSGGTLDITLEVEME